MERLTQINGIGEFELKACFKCGPGCGANNENCGFCERPGEAFNLLGKFEENGLTPDEITALQEENAALKDEMKKISEDLEEAKRAAHAAYKREEQTLRLATLEIEKLKMPHTRV